MPKLILHIGTEKTGTSSIQEWLARNREALLHKGFYIPDFLGNAGHRLMPVLFYPDDRNDDLTWDVLPEDTDARKRLIESLKERFRKEANQHCDTTWIISSEHLQARLKSREELRRLNNFLVELFDDIDVICYFRKPIDAAVSLWSTAARQGLGWTRLPPPGGRIDRICNHRKTCLDWQENVQCTLRPRLYAKSCFAGGTVISDFLYVCGIQPDDLETDLPELNTGMSGTALLMISEINKVLGRTGKDLDRRRGSLPEIIESALSKLPAYTPSAKDEDKYSEYYRDSNEFLRNRYFEGLSIAWDEASIRDQTDNDSERARTMDKPTKHCIMIEDAARIITEAWLVQQQRIEDLQKELSTIQHNHAEAQRRIEKIEKDRAWRSMELIRGIIKKR